MRRLRRAWGQVASSLLCAVSGWIERFGRGPLRQPLVLLDARSTVGWLVEWTLMSTSGKDGGGAERRSVSRINAPPPGLIVLPRISLARDR